MNDIKQYEQVQRLNRYLQPTDFKFVVGSTYHKPNSTRIELHRYYNNRYKNETCIILYWNKFEDIYVNIFRQIDIFAESEANTPNVMQAFTELKRFLDPLRSNSLTEFKIKMDLLGI